MGKHIREYSYHNCLKTVSIRQFWTAGNIVSIFPDKILLKIIREVFAENLNFTDFSLHFSDYFSPRIMRPSRAYKEIGAPRLSPDTPALVLPRGLITTLQPVPFTTKERRINGKVLLAPWGLCMINPIKYIAVFQILLLKYAQSCGILRS